VLAHLMLCTASLAPLLSLAQFTPPATELDAPTELMELEPSRAWLGLGLEVESGVGVGVGVGGGVGVGVLG